MKNNNLILVALISTLSLIVAVSTITYVHSQRPDNILIEMLEYEDKILDDNNSEINTTEHIPKFFAIQHAQSGLISEINETTYSLELNDVSDKTILFSDRPDRIVTSVSTADFVGNWSIGQNNYAIDAPNTVVVVDEIEQDVVIIELFNPVYDSNEKTLKYTIKLPSEFGQNVILLDDSAFQWQIFNNSNWKHLE